MYLYVFVFGMQACLRWPVLSPVAKASLVLGSASLLVWFWGLGFVA